VIFGAVWLAGAIYIGVHVFNGFHVGLSSCLPSDFPNYPRETIASVVVSDSLGNCTIQYRSRDSAADVQAFFEANLNQGDWTVTNVDEGQRLIRFARQSRPSTFGLVKVFAFPGQQTQFQIQLRAR